MELDAEEQELQYNLSKPEVVTKYTTAADVANAALTQVIAAAKPGARIVDLCALGDKVMYDGLAKKYPKLDKGVAFPTCISINQCAGHFSPLSSDNSVVKEGDVVKVDLAAHVDGIVSTAAHTFIATAVKEGVEPAPITGKIADVICAAHYASEIAHRLIRPGVKNSEVTTAINQVAKEFGCSVVEGVLSHELKRYMIDGRNCILSKETAEHKVEEYEFIEYTAFGVDICMSTGEGKTREQQARTTIFKRDIDVQYQLKMRSSRQALNEILKRFPTFPFTLRALKDEKVGRLGITEMLKHDMVIPYPVLYEKDGEIVAQFKFTVLVLPNSTKRLNSQPLPYVKSEKKIEDEELLKILAQSTDRKKKKDKEAKEETK